VTHVCLSAEDVLAIAGHALGDQEVVLRDAGLLESAVHRPAASMFGQEAYTDLFDKAAALLQSLLINHPLVDGNKRTAWVSCVVFLTMNGVELRPDVDAAERLVIAVASGEPEDVKVIGDGLRELAEGPV
jgi:death on curing protein